MEEAKGLSIIIPVYNSARYLPDCLNSIIASETPDIEILLIDDGSTDQSPEVCLSYQKKFPFVKYFRQENSGPSRARNYGVNQSQGLYIAFMDSDDYVIPSLFHEAVQQLQRGPLVDLQISDFRRVADNACVLDKVYQIKDEVNPIYDKNYLIEFLKEADCVWNIWRCFFRRDFLLENKLQFAEGYNIAEDLEFMVRLLTKVHYICFFHCPYYNYRVNYGASLTRRFSADRAKQLMEMLTSAAYQLNLVHEEQVLLGAKLAREYILNLPLVYEVPRNQRKAAYEEIKRAQPLLTFACGKIYKTAAKFIAVTDIKISAYILFLFKCCKRFSRKIKIKAFGNKRA